MNCAFLRIVCLSLAYILLCLADSTSQSTTSASSFAYCTNASTGCCERFCQGVEVVNEVVRDDLCSPLCTGVSYAFCAGLCAELSALGGIQGQPAATGHIPILLNSNDFDYCSSLTKNCCIDICRGFNFVDKLVHEGLCDALCSGIVFLACGTACVTPKGLQDVLGKEGVVNKLLQVLPK